MKSTALQSLTGVRNHNAPHELEPDYEVCAPVAPEYLSPEAAKHFDKMVAQLEEAGVMTGIDTDALALYCRTWTDWVAEDKALRKEGTIIDGVKGGKIRNPRIAIINQLYKQLQQMMAHFGITPKTRNKVQSIRSKGGKPTGKPKNRFAALGF